MRAFHVLLVLASMGTIATAAMFWKTWSSHQKTAMDVSNKLISKEPQDSDSELPEPSRRRITRKFQEDQTVQGEARPGRHTAEDTPQTPEQGFKSLRQTFERSGAAKGDIALRASGLLDAWRQKAPVELQAAVRLSTPECFALGCVFTADLQDSELVGAFHDKFVYESGFLEWQGFKTTFEAADSGGGSRNRLAFALYAPSVSPQTIANETPN